MWLFVLGYGCGFLLVTTFANGLQAIICLWLLIMVSFMVFGPWYCKQAPEEHSSNTEICLIFYVLHSKLFSIIGQCRANL